MIRSTSVDVDVDIDDVIGAMDEEEKRELYEELGEELEERGNITLDDDFNVEQYLGEKPAFELKRILCNALGVPSYYDEQALREKLEPVIKAR